MFCPTCGKETSEEASFCQYCGQPLKGPAPDQVSHPLPLPLPVTGPYAGFWRRFLAYIIDGILIFTVSKGAGAMVGFSLGAGVGLYGGLYTGNRVDILASVVGGVIAWLYWSLMESSAHQATLGKMALGLQVTDLHGAPISFPRATGRYFAKIISALIFCIGFMMIGWTAKKQGLHDIIAGTLVVKKEG